MSSSPELDNEDLQVEEELDEDELEAIFADEPEDDVAEEEDEAQPLKDNEIVVPSDDEEQDTTTDGATGSEKIIQLPLSRIKALMKADGSISITSAESVISVAKCTELFVKLLVKEMYAQMQGQKRKTLMKRDLEKAIQMREKLAFLEGTLE